MSDNTKEETRAVLEERVEAYSRELSMLHTLRQCAMNGAIVSTGGENDSDQHVQLDQVPGLPAFLDEQQVHFWRLLRESSKELEKVLKS